MCGVLLIFMETARLRKVITQEQILIVGTKIS